MNDESVTQWYHQLLAGNQEASRKLWKRFFERMVGVARKRLRSASRRVVDEEDIALGAFDSFCRDAGEGRFPKMGGRDSLWKLLSTMTAQKAVDQIRRERAEKRGGLQKRQHDGFDLDAVECSEAEPALAAQMAEECRLLLNRLGNEDLRTVALWKLDGYANEEIARKLNCVPRTVERRLRLIRAIWTNGPSHE